MGAVAVGFVRYDRRRLAGQGRGAAAGRVDAFLLLPAVTKPNPNHLLLHVQLLRHQQDLLRRRLLVLRRNKDEKLLKLKASGSDQLKEENKHVQS